MTTSSISPALVARRAIARRFIDAQLLKHGLHRWNVVFKDEISFDSIDAAAMCNTKTKTLTFAVHYILNTADEEWKNTVLHEIAHALTPGSKHDEVWREKFISIGGNGKQEVIWYKPRSIDRTKFKWVGQCPNCKTEVGENEVPAKVFSCARCSGDTFNKAYIFNWLVDGEVVPHEEISVDYLESYLRNIRD